MEGSDILQTIAEVAIALTGFTGIVVALAGRDRAALSGFAAARFQILLAGSLAALVFALLPFLLYHYGVPPSWIWSLCSGGVIAFLIPVAIVDARSFRAFADEVPVFERRAAPMIVILGSALFLSQVANVFSLHDFGLYLAAPIWFLAFSTLAFVRLLLELQRRG